MTRHNQVATDVLQERVNQMKAELAEAESLISRIEEERDTDLAVFANVLNEADMEAAAARQAQEEAMAAAESLSVKGDALIASGKQLLRQAQKQREEAAEMDLQLDPVKDATMALKERQKHWAERLGQVQDGSTRRKRARLERDLEKLERRLERKKETPMIEGTVPGIPPNLGTPKPEPTTVGGIPVVDTPEELARLTAENEAPK